MTRRQYTGRDIDAITGILSSKPTPADIWYGHSILTSSLFPGSKPDPGTDYFSKENGPSVYILEAGIDPRTGQRAFPYGKYPRLLMAWIAGQVRDAEAHAAHDRADDDGTLESDAKLRRITVPSMYQLSEELRLARGGRTTRRLGEQLRLLLSAHISIRRVVQLDSVTVRDTVSLPLATGVRYKDDNGDDGLSGAEFFLSRDVWERLARESAPCDLRAASFLLSGRSVLAYDVYVWVSGASASLSHPMTLPWDWLEERFGDGQCTRWFREQFRAALERVRVVYPGARWECGPRGLTLWPGEPSVPRLPAR